MMADVNLFGGSGGAARGGGVGRPARGGAHNRVNRVSRLVKNICTLQINWV